MTMHSHLFPASYLEAMLSEKYFGPEKSGFALLLVAKPPLSEAVTNCLSRGGLLAHCILKERDGKWKDDLFRLENLV